MKVFKKALEEKKGLSKPRKRWIDYIENDMKKMGVRGWRKITKN